MVADYAVGLFMGLTNTLVIALLYTQTTSSSFSGNRLVVVSRAWAVPAFQ
jgi:hypothetical protein